MKERAGTLGSEVGTLVFQPHVTLISGGVCTYRLYEFQVNERGRGVANALSRLLFRGQLLRT